MKGFCIPNLMYYLAGGMLVVFLLDLFLPQLGVYSYLDLDRALVAQGQVWRLVSFLFLPPNTSVVFILFSLYFYVLIGRGMESQWGAFRFNVFYFVGVIATIIAAMITGYGTNVFLNFSLFLAFAAIYPDYQLLVFFILPVKVKYLALLDVILYVWQFVVSGWAFRVAILAALLNFVLFFGKDFYNTIKMQAGFQKTRRNFRKNMRR